MEVTNPRRILAVSAEGQVDHLSRVIKDLTGSPPEPTSSTSAGPSVAGTTHPLRLKTAYYTATVPIWLDLIPDTDPADWASAFLAPEAREVLDVLGGVVVVFPVSSSPSLPSAAPAATDQTSPAQNLIRQVGRVVREGLGGWEWDGVGLAIGVSGGGAGPDADPDKMADLWEDVCAESGLEFVLVRSQEKDQGRNEFGEKMGIPRVLEALESNDWAQGPSSPADMEDDLLEDSKKATKTNNGEESDDDDDDEFDPENLDFGFDKADFEGLKKAIWGLDADDHDDDPPSEGNQGGDGPTTEGNASAASSSTKDEKDRQSRSKKDDADRAKGEKEDEKGDEVFDEALEVEKIEGMMRKLQAVRDMSAGLPEDQKRRMAAKAVAEVMKDL